MKRIKELSFAIAILASCTLSAHAATLGGTGTYSPGFDSSPDPDVQTLVLVEAGGIKYSPLGATYLAQSGSQGSLFGAANAGTPPNNASALSGLIASSGRTNMNQTDFTLGTTVNAGDAIRFFFGEINIDGQAGDNITIQPLSGGTPIAGWSLDIVAGDYGPQSGLMDVTNGVPDIGTRLSTFDLVDFTGGVGTLTGVDGLRFVGNSNFDPNLAGTLTAIPEPSSIAIWTILGCLGLGFFGRRVSRLAR